MANDLHSQSFFSKKQLASIQQIPRHIAIIPDANRRWALQHSRPCVEGYLQGAQRLISTALAAQELGVDVLTVYAFSTENWKRPQAEIEMLMQLFTTHLEKYCDDLVAANIRLYVIGNIDNLPPHLQSVIARVTATTQLCTGLELVLAMNYGGRNELVRAFKKIAAKHPDTIAQILSTDMISQALDTARWPDPDLLIRTGGDSRSSNFLLWQCAYAEIFIDQTLWPDFSPQHLLNAIIDFQNRQRRFGGEAFSHNQQT